MRYLLIPLIFGLLFAGPSFINAQNSAREWTFVNKKNGYSRVIKQDQKITVYWKSKKGPDISWGKLADISEDTLSLALKGHVVNFAKKDITEIKIKRKRSISQSVGGFLLIVGGVLITGFFFLLQALYDVNRLDVQLTAHEHTLIWPWASLGIGIIIWGIVILKSPNQRISRPFGENWSIEEVSMKPSNTP